MKENEGGSNTQTQEKRRAPKMDVYESIKRTGKWCKVFAAEKPLFRREEKLLPAGSVRISSCRPDEHPAFDPRSATNDSTPFKKKTANGNETEIFKRSTLYANDPKKFAASPDAYRHQNVFNPIKNLNTKICINRDLIRMLIQLKTQFN